MANKNNDRGVDFARPDPAGVEQAVAAWMRHIQELAGKIGPRGSATEGERRGSQYCAEVLAGLGFEPQVETFPSSGSVFRPHLVASVALLAAFAIYPLAGKVSAWVSAAIAVFVMSSEVLELGLRDNPLRWALPKRPSQNVYAVAEPKKGQARQDLVLIGHVDTQRTPIIFSTPEWLTVYRFLSTTAFASFFAQIAIYIYGALTGAPWVWPVSVIPSTFALLLLALTVHAELTPFTPGANDNASAAGLVLALGEVLRSEPMEHTRVWLVCTGSEEALHEGARHFFAAHKAEMVRPKTINFEMLGVTGPSWLVREGIVTSLHPSPELRALAERIAEAMPELEAYPSKIEGGVTEASDSIIAGVPAITLAGMDRSNHAPHWHKLSDTPDKMRPDVMAKAYTLAWAMMTALDTQAR